MKTQEKPQEITNATLSYFLASNSYEDDSNQPMIADNALLSEAGMLEKIVTGKQAISSMYNDVEVRISKYEPRSRSSLMVEFKSSAEDRLKEALDNYLFITQERLPDFVEAYGSELVGEILSRYNKKLEWSHNSNLNGKDVLDI
jgi:hypothetical protein